MSSTRGCLVMIAAATLLGGAAYAQSGAPDSVADYALVSPPSDFEWGCFGPCDCPILVQTPLAGSFVLRRLPVSPGDLYETYDVLDVKWKAGEGASSISITGSGTYRRGGEVAVMEELTLDLSFDGSASQHFDSGLKSPGAPFPEIRARISLHGEYCRDSVLTVDAKPTSVTGTDRGPYAPILGVGPNPFRLETEISFTLPRAGAIDLAIYDVSGRRVRALVTHEWMPSGTHARLWDGRFDTGAAAPAGRYVVRLETSVGRAQRSIVKLR